MSQLTVMINIHGKYETLVDDLGREATEDNKAIEYISYSPLFVHSTTLEMNYRWAAAWR